MCLVSTRSFERVAELTRENIIIFSFFPCGNYVHCYSRLVTRTRSHERRRCLNGDVLHSCCVSWRTALAGRDSETELQLFVQPKREVGVLNSIATLPGPVRLSRIESRKTNSGTAFFEKRCVEYNDLLLKRRSLFSDGPRLHTWERRGYDWSWRSWPLSQACTPELNNYIGSLAGAAVITVFVAHSPP